MRPSKTRRAGREILFSFVFLAGPVTAWLAVRHRHWSAEGAASFVLAAAGLSAMLAGFLRRIVREQGRAHEVATPPDAPTPEVLERWREWLQLGVTRVRTADGGQLAKMLKEGTAIDVRTGRVDHDAGLPRVRVGDRLQPWSAIERQWKAAQGRLIILGEPGYGKTVAALTIVKHINANVGRGQAVAEIFPLHEWQRWREHNPDASLTAWLVDQLVATHPPLPASVAQDLVARRFILPVFDALDELRSLDHRRACLSAIDHYRERQTPYRSFVLTCRTRAYRELAPDYITDSHCIVLVGLQPDQVAARLNELTAGRRSWEPIRRRHNRGDPKLNRLFASPLLLSLALQVYANRDPSELLDVDPSIASQLLWKRLLEGRGEAGYGGASPEQIRAWLSWLAVAMRRTGRQRLYLHELFLADSERHNTSLTFRLALGVLVGVTLGLVFLYGGRLAAGGAGLVIGALLGQVALDPWPNVPAPINWRAVLPASLTPNAFYRVAQLMFEVAAALGILVGVAVASSRNDVLAGALHGAATFIAALIAAELLYVSGAFTVAVFLGICGAVELVTGDPPSRIPHSSPDAVLRASRTTGIRFGLAGFVCAGVIASVAFTLLRIVVFAVTSKHASRGWLIWARTRIDIAVIGGVAVGLASGLGAWLYHYWLRWRMSRTGRLPLDLPRFLRWCASDDRRWIRITDFYEFRHRDMLEYLGDELIKPAPGRWSRVRRRVARWPFVLALADAKEAGEDVLVYGGGAAMLALFGYLGPGILGILCYVLAAMVVPVAVIGAYEALAAFRGTYRKRRRDAP